MSDILRILEPPENIKNNYEEASIEKKENVLMMKCKLQCMRIIQLILDYDVDLEVRSISKHFQNYDIAPREKKIGDAKISIKEEKI